MIPDNARLEVELEAQQWNQVMQVLGNGPFNIVAPLIDQIRQQCMRAAASIETQQPNGQTVMPMTN